MSTSRVEGNESAAEWIDLLDVSAANGVIDFGRVAAAEVAPGVARRWRGVLCKVSENETWKDQTRLANIAGARAAGLPFGAYAFLHPMGDMGKQVANAWEAVGDTMPSMALALDLEAADPSLSSQAIVDQLRRARDATRARFWRLPIVYSYPDFWARRMMPAAAQAPDLAELPLWWASYGAGFPWYPRRDQLPVAPEPWRASGRAVELWQYSGNTKKTPGAWTGRVDGIGGDVDRNVYTRGEEAFLYDFLGRPLYDQLEPEAPTVRPMLDFRRVDLGEDGRE